MNIYSKFGNVHEKITFKKISLPFPEKRKYMIMQGYNGSYSHNDEYSKYAIDFNLKVNDTVCAADNGVVVGVIKDYKAGGPDKKWKDYANYITLYHPETGLFTQYVHLKYNSSFVNVGDTVRTGQPIGISGKTGWVNRAHLHFNTLIPVENKDGLKSVPVDFTEGYTGSSFKPDDIVEKP